MSNSGLRIAWFSDLSIGRPESLSTYCSRLLLPYLSKQHQIEVFSDLALVDNSSDAFNLPYYNYLKAYQRHAERPFDLFFYQLEDSRACRFIRGHIGLMPGVVWMHDLFCNDLGPEACHTSPWELTIKQFYDPKLDFADRLKAPHQLWPRAFRETALSPVTLFSSRWALNEFSRMVCNRLESPSGSHRSEVLEVPIDLPVDPVNREDRQKELFTISTLSVPGIEGRMHKVLPVLRELDFPWKLVWMLDHSERERADSLIREFGISEDKVVFLSSREDKVWSDVVSESDVALHLHTSPFGHLAPFIQRSLLAGCPSVVALSAQGEDFPSDVVFGVTPGTHESMQLRLILEALARSPVGGVALAGESYARSTFSAELVAEKLSGLLTESAPDLSYVMDRWNSIRKRAQRQLVSEVQALAAGVDDDFIGVSERVINPALAELGWDF